jgi:hypothetical protein
LLGGKSQSDVVYPNVLRAAILWALVLGACSDDSAILDSGAVVDSKVGQDLTPKSGTVLYRFVSCSGGSASACGALGDLIPDEQQRLPHDAVAGCTGVTASYKQYPNCGHSLCGSQLCGRLESLTWLKSRGW